MSRRSDHEQIVQTPGEVSGGVLDISIARDDIGDVAAPAGTTRTPACEVPWRSLLPAARPQRALLNGDLALREDETDPFLAALLETGLVFQAYHQHVPTRPRSRRGADAGVTWTGCGSLLARSDRDGAAPAAARPNPDQPRIQRAQAGDVRRGAGDGARWPRLRRVGARSRAARADPRRCGRAGLGGAAHRGDPRLARGALCLVSPDDRGVSPERRRIHRL